MSLARDKAKVTTALNKLIELGVSIGQGTTYPVKIDTNAVEVDTYHSLKEGLDALKARFNNRFKYEVDRKCKDKDLFRWRTNIKTADHGLVACVYFNKVSGDVTTFGDVVTNETAIRGVAETITFLAAEFEKQDSRTLRRKVGNTAKAVRNLLSA